MWKMKWSTMTGGWDHKKSESPTGIEPMTSRTPGGHSNYWATRTHAERGILLSSYVTCILHTARMFGRSCMSSIPVRDSTFSLCPMLVATFTKLQIYHHLFNTQMNCTGFVLPNILHSYHNLGWGLSSINWYASGMPTFSSRSPASRKDCRKKNHVVVENSKSKW